MAAQQDTHPPVFAILNHPCIMMKSDYQDPPCRKCWSLYSKDQMQAALDLFPQHCSPKAEALSCLGFHHFWDTVSTPRG